MAIEQEDIERIAKAVAERVVEKARACRCGLAMWEASADTHMLATIIQERNLEGLETLTDLTAAHLGRIEDDCGVSTWKARGYLDSLVEALREKDWSISNENLQALKVSIRGPLDECARGQGRDYPPLVAIGTEGGLKCH